MPSWLIRLRDIVWPAVLAVVLAVLAILIAIIFPQALAAVLALGISSITMALLAQRA